MTKLLYLEDMSLLEASAIVEDVLEEDGKTVVILDQTIFYPQGGGQPYDKGTIKNESATFQVDEVRWIDGIVRHIGSFQSGSFKKGDEVNCVVEKERRELHMRIHSAGHVADMAINALGHKWIPGKGFHYPEGPYIEYAGTVDESKKEEIKKAIEDKCNEIIKQGAETTLRFMEKSKMHEVCQFVPDYLPEGKPMRVVMYGDFGVPCGGTHVANLSDIKSMTIRKIKQRGDVLRVAYDIAR